MSATKITLGSKQYPVQCGPGDLRWAKQHLGFDIRDLGNAFERLRKAAALQADGEIDEDTVAELDITEHYQLLCQVFIMLTRRSHGDKTPAQIQEMLDDVLTFDNSKEFFAEILAAWSSVQGKNASRAVVTDGAPLDPAK